VYASSANWAYRPPRVDAAAYQAYVPEWGGKPAERPMSLSDGLSSAGGPGVDSDPISEARRAARYKSGSSIWSQEFVLVKPTFPSGMGEESRSVLVYDEAAICEALSIE